MAKSEAPLAGRTVILGISGGIAAYKSVEILRRLQRTGADVVPVVTEAGRKFVAPMALESLTGRRVSSSLWNDTDPIPHTSLGQRADLILVAPATADLIARYRAGLASDLLAATLLASRAPVLLCPAMHTEMWEHPATQENIDVLQGRGVHVLEPAEGSLAGGDMGIGRMREPAEIVEKAQQILLSDSPLTDLADAARRMEGVRVLVTAGGTRESIDPVRFIGNRSSGKMGHAIAAEAARRGAAVVLVTASDARTPAGIEVIRVQTAAEMEKEVLSRFADSDVVFMAAAVADFRPRVEAGSKIKKSDGPPLLELEPTPDILARLGEEKASQFVVGFAAETDDLVENAKAKLERKKIDLIVANDVSAADSGFEVDTNRAVLLWRAGEVEDLPLALKSEIAAAIVERVAGALED
ncbi:MAG: bifunctional phosphopantothenoylcysteine decarboxylase/phosphopantothenate--cysteine ligase CoaBC [Acidobacteria bacterium]|nr:MAG: bifunctional phosphopantothenoylcysteine decarboxylase/phosphopantothenate--cysteine ligase CoaBC [Acidobacteriota bacterium]